LERKTIEEWYKEAKKDNIEFWRYPEWIENKYKLESVYEEELDEGIDFMPSIEP